MHIKSPLRNLALFCSAALIPFTSIQAASLNWTGATDGNWATSTNWTGGTPGTADALTFGGSGNPSTTNNLTSYTVNSITFSSGASAFTLAGNAITLAGGITNSSTALQTISLNMATSAVQTVTTAASGGDAAISGIISGGGGIIKAGTGVLTLSGHNTYSGGTTLNAGVVSVSQNDSLGSGAVNFATLGTLQAVERDVVLTTTGGTFGTMNVSGTQSISLGGTYTGTSGNDRFINNTLSAGKTLTLNNININEAGSTRAVTFSGTGNTVVSGTIGNGAVTHGKVTITSTGLTVFSGANTYSNITTISAGTLQFAKTASLYNANTTLWTAGRIIVASGGTFAISVGGADEFTTGNVTTLLTNLAASTSATSGMSAGSALGFDTTNAAGGSFTVADVLTDTSGATGGARGVTKLGTNTLVLSNVNTFTGATKVNAGTLLINGTGSINATSGVAVTGAGTKFRYDSSVALSRNIAVSSGGIFSYSSAGNYSGAFTFTNGKIGGTNWNGNLGGLTVGANQTISPGNSPGTATTTSQTWASAGSYDWEINKATGGTAGADPGWDLINLSTGLTISATSSVKFTINLISLQIDNTAGQATGFSSGLNYNWMIADSASAIVGFSADKFALNTSAFANAYDGTFGIALGDSAGIGGDNTQLYLTYTAVPEPSTWALIALSAGAVITFGRRRKS